MIETFTLSVEYDELEIAKHGVPMRDIRATLAELIADGARAELIDTVGDCVEVRIK